MIKLKITRKPCTIFNFGFLLRSSFPFPFLIIHSISYSSLLLPVSMALVPFTPYCSSTSPLFSSKKCSVVSNSQLIVVSALSSRRSSLINTRRSLRVRSAVTFDSPASSSAHSSDSLELLLEVKDLSAVVSESKQPVLKGVNLTIHRGEVGLNYPIN